jgi:hypothetical protein
MIKVGRRPVLILWATIVAERLGFERDEALTLGRALASFGGSMIKAPPDAVTPAKIAEMRAKLQPGQTINVSFIDRVVSIAREPLCKAAKLAPLPNERRASRLPPVTGSSPILAWTISSSPTFPHACPANPDTS